MQLRVFAVASEASQLLTLQMSRSCLSCTFCQANKGLTVDRWVTRRRDKVRCEAEQSGAVLRRRGGGAGQWGGVLVERYNRRCAWLQAITGAVKEVHVLFTHYFTPSLTHSHMHLVM